MDAVSLLAQQVRSSHEIVEGTVADLTPEQASWIPAGKAIAAGQVSVAYLKPPSNPLEAPPIDH